MKTEAHGRKQRVCIKQPRKPQMKRRQDYFVGNPRYLYHSFPKGYETMSNILTVSWTWSIS